MKRRTIAIVAIVMTAAALAGGCSKKQDASKSASEQSSSNSGETKTAKSGEKGIDAPSNDKTVVAAAKKALGCKWTSYGLAARCEAYKAWRNLPAIQDGKADETLLRFVGDSDPKVRWLGAKSLSYHGKGYKKDKAMVSTLIDYLEKEKDQTARDAIAQAIGGADLQQAGMNERVKKLLSSSKDQKLRLALIGKVLHVNAKAPGMFELFLKLARSDKDPKVRRAASSAFWTGTPHEQAKRETVCKLWLEQVKTDTDPQVAGEAAHQCGGWSYGCKAQWGEMLDAIESKAKEGKVKDWSMAVGVKDVYKSSKASADLKNKALEVAKAIVSNTGNDAKARADALRLVGKNTSDGKAFAKKFVKDSEFFVRSAAEDVLKG